MRVSGKLQKLSSGSQKKPTRTPASRTKALCRKFDYFGSLFFLNACGTFDISFDDNANILCCLYSTLSKSHGHAYTRCRQPAEIDEMPYEVGVWTLKGLAFVIPWQYLGMPRPQILLPYPCHKLKPDTDALAVNYLRSIRIPQHIG